MEEIVVKYKNGSTMSHVYPEHPDGFYKAYLVVDESDGGYKYTHFGTNVRGDLYLDSTMLNISDVMTLCDIMEPYVDENHLTVDGRDVQTYDVGDVENGTRFIIGNGHIYISSNIMLEEDIADIIKMLDLDTKLIK